MRRGIFVFCAGMVAVLLLIQLQNASPVFGQSPLRWSRPQQIRGIANDINPPYLIADRNRTLHAFYTQYAGDYLAVYYNQWTSIAGWTTPIDILLSPNKGQAAIMGTYLDSKGLFHAVFYGGIAEGAEIYHSSAPALNAAQARGWSKPQIVGIGATSPGSATIIGDERDNLFVLYSGLRDGYGVYATNSVDGGTTWADPTALFLTRSRTQSTCCLQVYSDEQGWLHAIWLVVDKVGQGRAIYYARLNTRDKQWSFPVPLAQTPSGLGVRDPAIIKHRGLLIAVFYDADLGGHLAMRTSNDDGQSWSDLFAPFPRHVGANGAGSFAVDSNNDLHLIWGERITGNPDIHGIWHSVRKDDKNWSEPEPIISGPQTAEFDPSAPRAIVSQGNVLMATWRQDPGLAGNGVSYSYVTLRAPELPISPLQSPLVDATTSLPSPIPTEPVLPTRTAFPRPAYTPRADDTAPVSLESNPNLGVLIAILPVIVILLVLVVVRSLRGSP